MPRKKTDMIALTTQAEAERIRYGSKEVIGPFGWFLEYLYDSESENGAAFDFFSITDPVDRATFISKLVETAMKFPAETRARSTAKIQLSRAQMEGEAHNARMKSGVGGGFSDVIISMPFGTAGPWPEKE